MGGFRLGSILGFEIRVDYSWFIIFFLILWSLTSGLFPRSVPGLSPGTYLAMGVAGTVLFFASLIAHELAHSLVARAKGIPMQGITLFVFGGLAHTRTEAETPGDELLIGGVGPVASVAIGSLFGLAAWVGQRQGWSPIVTTVAGYLGFINVVLAGFNLLPGFPLDGGRVFRAAVWKLTGDRTKATRWAANGGKILGYVLIGLGLFQIFAAPGLGGLWLVLIGWFVRTAAEASLTQHLLRESLQGVRAADLMTPSPEAVPAHLPLQTFVEQYILRGRHRTYPVTEGDRLLGTISLERVKSVPRERWSDLAVGEVMAGIDEAQVVQADEKMSNIIDRIGGAGPGRVFVASNGTLEGIITRADLSRWLERAMLLERA